MEKYMIKTVLQLKKGLDDDTLKMCQNLIENAFDNRCGSVKNSTSDEQYFVFKGGENERPCLEVGVFILKRTENFLNYVEQWEWLETDPDESCNVLQVFEEYVS